MLRSMTGFGKSQLTNDLGNFNLEISSVNRKFFEVNGYLPREFQFLEFDIKKWVSESIQRGQVNYKLTVNIDTSAFTSLKSNISLARQYKNVYEQMAKELGLSNYTFDLSSILQEKNLFYMEENETKKSLYINTLESLFKAALKQLVELKEAEGNFLEIELKKNLEFLQKILFNISLNANHAVEKYKEKITSKINEWALNLPDNEDKVLREVCLYAEKADITEEITRFNSHIQRFSQTLESKEISKGKLLEFILQEMLREMNTIGSKSNDITITNFVISGKAEIEKIREQIQNIE
ncbi:hypothetical protein BN1013_01194 [Candidatus Rubidus massiliensis]|nr:hypothetical protein BN1013_01194 [Candidatus Rubidus massiliensis]